MVSRREVEVVTANSLRSLSQDGTERLVQLLRQLSDRIVGVDDAGSGGGERNLANLRADGAGKKIEAVSYWYRAARRRRLQGGCR